jgi:transcriptional regulator with XRE-family HTH domain
MNKAIDSLYEEVGRRIVSARKSKGISQERLAAECEIDRSHIGFIEQGRRRPTLSTLYKIAKALDTSLEKLLKGL